MDELAVLTRIGIAALLGAAVGFERERVNRAAGLRTHILVCVGAALVMIVSISMSLSYPGSDPSRIAAQVVTGVGFLGAGTIMREGASVRGLTTAAALWVVSGLGLAAGAGMYVAATIAAAAVLAALHFLPPLERRIARREGTVFVRMEDRPGQLGNVACVLGRHGIDIRHVEIEPGDDGTVEVSFRARFQGGFKTEEVASDLAAIDGVRSVEIPRG
ncbi:MAG: MgtC/SapB family protein [Firmicutes bacterium]|nr:MgtC/SapB family protein [Bacillota bacterium]